MTTDAEQRTCLCHLCQYHNKNSSDTGLTQPSVLQVESLSGIASATNHEVTIQHLGPRFAAAAGRFIADGLAKPAGPATGRSSSGLPTHNPNTATFAMPSFSSAFANVSLTEQG